METQGTQMKVSFLALNRCSLAQTITTEMSVNQQDFGFLPPLILNIE